MSGASSGVEQATRMLARAWNRLDPGLLRSWLTDDVVYASQETDHLIRGRTRVLAYLERKMGLILELDEEALVRAQMGSVPLAGRPDHPCVISGQGGLERAALFLVEVDHQGRIAAITVSTSSPDPRQAEASGEFPG